MEDLNLELRLAPYLCKRGTHGFITSRTEGDDNSDDEVHGAPSSRKKICLFRCSSMSTANAQLDLDLRLGIGDPNESCDGVALLCSLDDIIEFVLPYLDKESLVRSKIVSRSWNRLVSARSHLPIKFSFSGIVFQDTSLNPLSLAPRSLGRVKFLQLDHTGGAAPCSPYRIWCCGAVMGSCNGRLLLFMTLPPEEICVYDPINRAVTTVPQAASRTIKYGGSCNGLAFDGQQYLVVSIFRPSDDEFHLQIFFSNEIASSRRLELLHVQIPAEVDDGPDLLVNESFFSFKGYFSFLHSDWLLLYAVKNGRASFRRLPHGPEASNHRRCMWQSEGRIYYGFGCDDDGGFQIWELVHGGGGGGGGGDPSSFDANECQWQLRESYEHETLAVECPEIFGEGFGSINVSKDRIGPCAFNDDFQILYIYVPGKLVSYHLKTRRFRMAFAFPDCGKPAVSRRFYSYCFRPKPCKFLF